MKARSVLYGAALVVVTATITSTVVSQEAKNPQAPEMTPAEKAMMDKWMAFAAPGEQHQMLAKRAGKWNFHLKWWESADQTPSESDGTSESKMIMDGRYLVDHSRGESPWGPFEGMGCTGYDNLKKKFVGIWLDNMGTGIAYQEGTYDPATKTLSYRGEMPDVMAGKYVPSRSTEKWLSDDSWVMEAFGKGPDGKEFKNLEITFTRAK